MPNARHRAAIYERCGLFPGLRRFAARAVGAVMRTNYDPSIPCHRVIASDGSMRGYNRGGVERKKEILFDEGVKSVAISR